MSHMTADLEYFKCDMCGVYMHRDIFCDHRRDCHGRNSTTLKRGECAMLSEALGRETRELLLSRENNTGTSTAANSSSAAATSSSGAAPSDNTAAAATSTHATVVGNQSGCATVEAAPSSAGCEATPCAAAALFNSGVSSAGTLRASVSTAELERRQEARTRRAVSDRYQATLDAKISSMLTTEKKAALMDFLNS